MLSVLLLGLVLECTHPGVLSGCEKFLCQLFNKFGFSSAEALRWFMFKPLKGNQGVEKLFSSQGCIIEH